MLAERTVSAQPTQQLVIAEVGECLQLGGRRPGGEQRNRGPCPAGLQPRREPAQLERRRGRRSELGQPDEPAPFGEEHDGPTRLAQALVGIVGRWGDVAQGVGHISPDVRHVQAVQGNGRLEAPRVRWGGAE
jgi:hypothetical protein